jgi:hypothetical protein
LARVFKFCTMAARWNSSRAPEKPRNRIRSKPWCVFRCLGAGEVFDGDIVDTAERVERDPLDAVEIHRDRGAGGRRAGRKKALKS